MKNCPLCSQELADDAKFCKNCGANLEMPTQEQKISNEPAPVEEMPKKKKSSMMPKIIAGCLVIVLIVGAVAFATFGKNLFDSRTNGEKLMDASLKSMEAKSMDMDFKVSLSELNLGETEDLTTTMIANMAKDVSLSGNMIMDRASKQAQMNMNIGLRDTTIVSMVVYANEKEIIVNLPELYDQPFYISWDELKKRMEEESGETVDISMDQILDLMEVNNYKSYKDFDMKPYKTIYSDFFDSKIKEVTEETITLGDKEIKADKYSVAMNYEESQKLMMDLVKIAVKDTSLKALVMEAMEKFYAIAKTSGQFTEEDYTTMKETFETEWSNIDVEALEAEQETMMATSGLEGLEMDYIYDFYLVKDDIRKTDMTMTMGMTEKLTGTDMDIKMTMKMESNVNILDQAVTFVDIKKEACVNLTELTDDELMEIGNKIEENATALIAGGLF